MEGNDEICARTEKKRENVREREKMKKKKIKKNQTVSV
jgi:hypothetical protein